MSKERQIKRKTEPDYEEIMKRTSQYMGDPAFRNFLSNVKPHCSVSCDATDQGGVVVEVVRDKFGVPACVKVRYEVINSRKGEAVAWGYDYIPVQLVSFWEPYDEWEPDENYDDDESWREWLLSQGYIWVDEEGGYFYNSETGDKVVW